MKAHKITCFKKHYLLIASIVLLFIIYNLFNKNYYEKSTPIEIFSIKEYFIHNIPNQNRTSTTTTNIPEKINNLKSTCGQSSDDLGPGQNVISYSFFKLNDDFLKYTKGIEENILALRRVYNLHKEENGTIVKPWIIRIYSDSYLKVAQILTQKYPKELFWCDVREIIPDTYSTIQKMVWRFLPLGDPTVDIFLSRDLDGILTKREKYAVDEWIMSNYPFHSMRDHPKHKHLFLGGMWGAKNKILGLEKAQGLRQELIEAGAGNMNDQQILEKIFKKFSDQIYSHDSFHCKEYGDYARPWPTQRDLSGDFVGKPVFRYKNNKVSVECPIECRPEQHQDWIYC